MTEEGGRRAALRSTIQFADLLQRGAPRPGSDSYLTTCVYSSFEHGTCPREEPNIFVPIVLPVQRCSRPASRGLS